MAVQVPGGRAVVPDATPDLVGAVEHTPLRSTPFAHLYLSDVFTPAYYRSLLDRLPTVGSYRDMIHRGAMRADGRSARRKFYLFPEHLALLPAEHRRFWLPLSQALRSRDLEDAFKRKFREPLERRFGRSIERLRFYPVPMLLRDIGGYSIGIHGDSLSKAITVQIYLPPDTSQAHLGTIFHEGRDGEAAARTTKLAFLPASGYAFPVVYHESWHSVAAMSDTDGPRDSLMLSYYVQTSALEWMFQRLKRAWLLVAYAFRR
jgi:hypothetical protein